MAETSSEEAVPQLRLAKELETSLPECWGTDSDRNIFRSLSEFWRMRVGDDATYDSWYGRSTAYWESDSVTPTLDGVLGGFSDTNGCDIAESAAVLRRIFGDRTDRERALGTLLSLFFAGLWRAAFHSPTCSVRALYPADVAGGVGRVAKDLLYDWFHKVDIVRVCGPIRIHVAWTPAWAAHSVCLCAPPLSTERPKRAHAGGCPQGCCASSSRRADRGTNADVRSRRVHVRLHLGSVLRWLPARH